MLFLSKLVRWTTGAAFFFGREEQKVRQDRATSASAPLLLRLSLHHRHLRVLHLEPIGRAAGAVGRVLSLRHDPFKPSLQARRSAGGAVNSSRPTPKWGL